jgi:Protein of unknown function (DUF4241)
MRIPSYLNYLLQGNCVLDEQASTFSIHNLYVADVSIPSGRLVATDPFLCDEMAPFLQEIKPGIYPIFISWIDIHSSERKERLIGGASVKLAPSSVHQWDIARIEGRDLDSPEVHCYFVDGATGSFMDEQLARSHLTRLEADNDCRYAQSLADQMESSDWTWKVLELVPELPLDCVAFFTGEGDGIYPSYIGYGSSDQPVVILTDFKILPLVIK